MERQIFDNKKLISLVELYECIWDNGHTEYTDRNKKQQAWINICEEMYENYDELTAVEQSEYGKEIQKKWKSLRNSFARELAKRKNKKNESGATWKTYIFFEQMSFLLRCVSTKETTSNFSEENDQTQDSMMQEDKFAPTPVAPEPLRKKNKSSSKNDADSHITELLKESLNRPKANESQLDQDEDRHFLLSLLGDFKRLPVERKMDVKLAILQAIKNGMLPIKSDYSP